MFKKVVKMQANALQEMSLRERTIERFLKENGVTKFEVIKDPDFSVFLVKRKIVTFEASKRKIRRLYRAGGKSCEMFVWHNHGWLRV